MGSAWIFLLLITLSLQGRAHEPSEGKVLGTFGPFLHQTHAIQTPDSALSPPLVGVGLLAEGDLSNYGGIEIGLFYIHKNYLRNFKDGRLIEKVHKFTVPVGYRYWLNETFSMGLFFTSVYSVGEYQTVYSNTLSFEPTSARETTEYGFEYSFQWEFWKSEKLAGVFDGRYFYSISAKSGEDAHQYGGLVGIKYMVQEK